MNDLSNLAVGDLMEGVEREQRKNNLGTFVVGTLAFILPFVIYGIKAKLEGKLDSNLYQNAVQKQVYDVNEPIYLKE